MEKNIAINDSTDISQFYCKNILWHWFSHTTSIELFWCIIIIIAKLQTIHFDWTAKRHKSILGRYGTTTEHYVSFWARWVQTTALSVFSTNKRIYREGKWQWGETTRADRETGGCAINIVKSDGNAL